MRRYRHLMILAGIVLAGAALRLWCWVGPGLSDEIRFATVAKNMANGFLPDGPSEWFGTRVGLLAPVALIFKVFGAGDASLAAWALIGSLGSVVVAYLLGRDLVDVRVGLVAAGLVAMAPIEIRLGMFMRPDAIMPAFVGLSVWCALRTGAGSTRTAWWAFAGGASLAFAWSIRENALLLAPIVILAAWPAIRRAILPGIAGALSIPAVTCLVWVLAGGSALAPLASAGSELEYRNPVTAWDFGESYTWELIRSAAAPGRLLFLALPVVAISLGLHWFRGERRVLIPTVWLGWTFLYLEFGTLVNLDKPYRYLTMCVIPAALIIALAIDGRFSWIGVVATGLIAILVLSSFAFQQYRNDDVALFGRVQAELAKLPPGSIATESYTWWKKFQIYLATDRLTVSAQRDPAFSTPREIAQSRWLRPLPSITDATYLVTGPVHRLTSWPTNWSDYRRRIPSTRGLPLIADLGAAKIWRLPTSSATARR